MNLFDVELVQRTLHLLAYRVTKHDGRDDVGDVEIGNVRLTADASAWRDRPIHKLVTTPVRSLDEAQRLFQGVGLIDPAHVGVLRGRLTVIPDGADRWGVCAVERDGKAALFVATPNVRWEASAIVMLEVERNR